MSCNDPFYTYKGKSFGFPTSVLSAHRFQIRLRQFTYSNEQLYTYWDPKQTYALTAQHVNVIAIKPRFLLFSAKVENAFGRKQVILR